MHIASPQELEKQLPPPERRWFGMVRAAAWTIAGVYFLAALAVLALRFLVLPHIGNYTERIAAVASRAVGARVTIGAVAAQWHGLHPRLELAQLRVYDAQGEEALHLPYAVVTVAWRSLLYGRLVLGSVTLEAPDLHIRRDHEGRLFVAGLELQRSEDHSPGLTSLLLDMRELVIREATLEWQDELRGAPPLTLQRLYLLLENRGSKHRFAISAEPPPELAAPLDVRGELLGRGDTPLAQWDGRLYAASDFIDLPAWGRWFDYPLELSAGRGALRMWSTLRDWQPTEIVADVSLAEISGRLAPDLPKLELASLTGRLGAREVMQGFEIVEARGEHEVIFEAFARKLAFETGAGVVFAPTDIEARWDPGHGERSAQGSLSANAVELQPLTTVSETLPLPARLRKQLERMTARGRVEELRLAWTGPLEDPVSFAGHARFSDLGVKAHEHWPGFMGVSGTIDLTDKGGQLMLDAKRVTIDIPERLAERSVLDRLTAKVAWTRGAEGFAVNIEHATAENDDAAVDFSGSYRAAATGPGYADFSGKIARVDGRRIYRYIPELRPAVAQWLKERVVAGQGLDGRFRLKGELSKFPFADSKEGLFEVAAKISHGALAYADDWPALEGVEGEIVLSGRKLGITAAKASMLGVQLANVSATIENLFDGHPVLAVAGQADGKTQDFLQFIARSPVREYTEGAFDGWTAEGNGKLGLELLLPLSDLATTRVRGNYQLAGNRIDTGFGIEPLAQVTGRVDFSETDANATNLSAQWLGGPLNAQVATRADRAVTVSAQGTADVAAALQNFGLPGAGQVSGRAPYRFQGVAQRGQLTQVIESTLQGVTSSAPPPFAKNAAESMPLRIERTLNGPDTPARRETVALTLGNLLNARAQLRRERGTLAIERGAIGVGDVVPTLPERPGVVLWTNLKTLDLDPFLALARTEEADSAMELSALDIKAAELIVLGRRFNEVAARASRVSPGQWQTFVNAKEVTGEIWYGSGGKGTVVAILKRLVQPESVAAPGAPNTTLDSLPAISLTAETYVYNGRNLGRLDLRAVNERRGWRLDQAMLSSEDCTFSAEGLWQPQSAGAKLKTAFDFVINASDAGKCLARVGHADTVARGTAKLEGKVSWNGPPFAIDYPSLTGSVSLAADQGQFVKLKPGIGKLLGVLSLQSLPRRISLDFRDVFSEGFAFDALRATAAINAGVMTTSDFTMAGPSATVALNGQVDLAKEVQDLNVRVVPVIGDSAAAGVALLNPIIGAGVFIAQRLLRDPIGQMFAFEYHITGSWDEPLVEKLRVPKAAAASPDAPAGN